MPDLNEHAALLRKWKTRPHHVGRGFVSDGPLDPERWDKAEHRVLFLLKEAYNEPGDTQEWDLREYLRARVADHHLGFTFWTVAYWNYLLRRLHGSRFPQFPSSQPEYDAAREELLDAAVVNVKKSGGISTSDPEDLGRYVERDGDLIKKQVDICRPHVVVCGNTWAVVRRLWSEARPRHDLVWEIADSCIAVDFVHPALRILQKLPYYALAAVAANARGANAV